MNQYKSIQKILRAKGKTRNREMFLQVLNNIVQENSHRKVGEIRNDLVQTNRGTSSFNYLPFIIGLSVLVILLIATWIVPFDSFSKKVLHLGIKVEFIDPVTMITEDEKNANYKVFVTQEGEPVPDGTKVVFWQKNSGETNRTKIETATDNGYAILYPEFSPLFKEISITARSGWTKQEIQVNILNLGLSVDQGSLALHPDNPTALTIRVKNYSDVSVENIVCKITQGEILIENFNNEFSRNIQRLNPSMEYSEVINIRLQSNQSIPQFNSIRFFCSLQNPERVIASIDIPVTISNSLSISSSVTELHIPNDGFSHDIDFQIFVSASFLDSLANLSINSVIEPSGIGTLTKTMDLGNGNLEYTLSIKGVNTENARIRFSIDNNELIIPLLFNEPKVGFIQPGGVLFLNSINDVQLATITQVTQARVFSNVQDQNLSRSLACLDVYISKDAILKKEDGSYSWNSQWISSQSDVALSSFVSNIKAEIGKILVVSDFSKVLFSVNEQQSDTESWLITIEGWVEDSAINIQ